MKLDERQRAYWRRNLTLTLTLLSVWFGVTFIGGYYARELNALSFMGFPLGFYLFAEYINMFISSAVMATLFFGGYDIPFVNEASLSPNLAAVLSVVSLFIKILCFIFLIHNIFIK